MFLVDTDAATDPTAKTVAAGDHGAHGCRFSDHADTSMIFNGPKIH